MLHDSFNWTLKSKFAWTTNDGMLWFVDMEAEGVQNALWHGGRFALGGREVYGEVDDR
jgi:hypothetical protein